MAGTLDYNANLDVKGNIKLKDTPNQTGSVLLKGTGTSIISTRTNAQFISDLNLALKNDSRFHSHDNKSVLDSITSTKVSNWDTAYTSMGNYVPYTGATTNVNLGTRSITSTGGFIGNATTATTLATARTINGTSFNGSANIVTANWGTARNITIGNTTKSVNGSGNYSWSLAEIGATTESWVNSQIDNIEIGGRNYFLNSSIERSYDNTNGSASVILYTHAHRFERNSEYTVSFDARGVGAIGFVVPQYSYPITSEASNGAIGSDGGGSLSINVSNGYQRFWIKIKTTNWGVISVDKPINLYAREFSEVFIKNLKLERGNQPTDWSPAPEDKVSDWSETDSNAYSFIKNKPTIPNGNDYVKKIGDTMTGTLVGSMPVATPMIDRTISNGSGAVLARFSNAQYDKGFGITLTGDLAFGLMSQANSLSSNWDKLWHSGNLLPSSINNWNTAYGWGDHSLNSVTKYTNTNMASTYYQGLDFDNLDAGNYAIAVASGTNVPSGIGTIRGLFRFGSSHVKLRNDIAIGSSGLAFRSSINNLWRTVWTDVNFDPAQYVPTSRTLTAGNGLSGGGNLTANRTFTLGTPSAIGLSTTNSVTSTSHTHAFTPGGTTAQYIRGDGSLATYANTTYTAGSGLTLSGTVFSLPVTQSGSGNYVSSVVQSTGGITVTKATLPIPALITSTTATGTTNVATTNTNTFLNVVSGGVATGSSTKITGAGSVTVASNTAGQLTITGTNTTYSTGTLQQLQTGADTVGRLQTSKNLNDWLDSKYVPTTQVFEKTPQGGLKVKDWDSIAGHLGAISIGKGSGALRPNALAMMSGSIASGISSISIGVMAQAIGTRSVNNGHYSTTFATDSYNYGTGLINHQMGCTIVGRYNNPLLENTVNTLEGNPLLFVIGNGKDSMLKSNSLEHYADGSTNYYGRQYYNPRTRQESWFQEDNTLVDVAYLKANGSGLTPNPDALPYEAYSGDVLEGQSSNADKLGEYVYYKQDGTWAYISSGGSDLNTARYAVTYGIWLGGGKVLLRGYLNTGLTGSLYRGRVIVLKSQSNPTHSVIKQNEMTSNDVYLGTMIGIQGVVFFNPK